MSSASAGKYSVKEFDDFTDKTTVRHKHVLSCGGVFDGSNTVNKYSFRLRQVKTKDFEAICLDCEIQAKDWFHARNGRVIFNCDQQNFSLDFSESSSKADHIGDTLYCFENGHYILAKDELQAICNAKVVKMRIQGDSQYEEPGIKWMQKFQVYCIQFRDDVFPEGRSIASSPGAAVVGLEQNPASPPTARTSSSSGSSSRLGTLAGVLIVGIALGMWLWSKVGPHGSVGAPAQTVNSVPSPRPTIPPSPVPEASSVPSESHGANLVNSTVKAETYSSSRSERSETADADGMARDNGAGRQGVDVSEFRPAMRAPTPAVPVRSGLHIQDGMYQGTLSCGPLLGKADSNGWHSPLDLTIFGDQLTWRRGNDQFEENGQSVANAAGFKIDALGYYYPTASRPGRWRTRGTLMLDNSTLSGAFEQVDPSGERQNRVCRVVVPVTLGR